MSLRSRLARLSDSTQKPSAEKLATEKLGSEQPARDGASAGTSPKDVLRELREKMARILEKDGEQAAARSAEDDDASSSSKRRQAFSVEQTTLPFAVEQTSHGSLCVRKETLASGYHVGRMPVSSALGAKAELLALLALDPDLADVDTESILFFDTETTGLSGAGTFAFLAGLGYFEAGEFVVEQLLLTHPADERALLVRLAEHFERASLLTTFNGKAFDWPLIRDRYVMNRRKPPEELPHLDLLHVGRRLHRARVGRCTLKALESEVLGFDREPSDIHGSEVAACYHHFLRTGDETALQAVVDHNFWDVISMAALLGLYGEPLDLLHQEDLVGLAGTFKRARAYDEAARAAARAHDRGAGPGALRMRAHIEKARGDKAEALANFERAAEHLDDPGLRLELAKLYEHYVKEPARALEMIDRGTLESDTAHEKRRARLVKKLTRSTSKS